MRISVCAAVLLCACLLPLRSEALDPGTGAPPFEVQYEGSRVLRSADLAGSVIVITCEARHTIGINQPFKDALLAAFPQQERERLTIALVPVVACFQYPWPIKGFCVRGVQDSVKEVNLQLYVDISGDLFKNYKAPLETGTVVVIDRGGVVRYFMPGKIPDEDVGSVVELVRALAENKQQPLPNSP